MLFYSDNVEVYGSFGSYDGKLQGQIGVHLKLREDTSIHAAFTKGERKNLKEGVSTFVVYRPLQMLKLYSGFEYMKEFQDPVHSVRANGTVDRIYVVPAGGQLILMDNESWFNNSLKVSASFSAEYQKTVEGDGYAKDRLPENDFVIGAGFNAKVL